MPEPAEVVIPARLRVFVRETLTEAGLDAYIDTADLTNQVLAQVPEGVGESSNKLVALIIEQLKGVGFTEAEARCSSMNWRSRNTQEIRAFPYEKLLINMGDCVPKTRRTCLAKLGSFKDVEVEIGGNISIDDLPESVLDAHQRADPEHLYNISKGRLSREKATLANWRSYAQRRFNLQYVETIGLYHACRVSRSANSRLPRVLVNGSPVPAPRYLEAAGVEAWRRVYLKSLRGLFPIIHGSRNARAPLRFAERFSEAHPTHSTYNIDGVPTGDAVKSALKAWLDEQGYRPILELDGSATSEFVHKYGVADVVRASRGQLLTIEHKYKKPVVIRCRSGFRTSDLTIINRYGLKDPLRIDTELLNARRIIRVDDWVFDNSEAGHRRAWVHVAKAMCPSTPVDLLELAVSFLPSCHVSVPARAIADSCNFTRVVKSVEQFAGCVPSMPWDVLVDLPVLPPIFEKYGICIDYQDAKKLSLCWPVPDSGIQITPKTKWLFFADKVDAYCAIFKKVEATLTDDEAYDLAVEYRDRDDLPPWQLVRDQQALRSLVEEFLKNRRDPVLKETEEYRKSMLERMDPAYPLPELTDDVWNKVTPAPNARYEQKVELFKEHASLHLVRHPTLDVWACVPSKQHALVYVLRGLGFPDRVANRIAERLPDVDVVSLVNPHDGRTHVEYYEIQQLVDRAFGVNIEDGVAVPPAMSKPEEQKGGSRWSTLRAGLAGVASGIATGAGVAAAQRLNKPVVDLVLSVQEAFYVPRFVRESAPNKLVAELVGPFACAAIGHGLRGHLPDPVSEGLALAGKLGGAGVGQKLAERLLEHCGRQMLVVADHARSLTGDPDAMRRVFNTTATEVDPIKRAADLDRKLAAAAERLGVDPTKLREELDREPVYAK